MTSETGERLLILEFLIPESRLVLQALKNRDTLKVSQAAGGVSGPLSAFSVLHWHPQPLSFENLSHVFVSPADVMVPVVPVCCPFLSII